MGNTRIEIGVGLFILLGLGCLGYLAITLGDLDLFGAQRYELSARFTSSSGLKQGAYVEVGGVRVGKVGDIELDYASYEAVVHLELDPALALQEDSIASIRTEGIIGDKFVKITPGGSETMLESGGEIMETEASISLEELISKYIFESDSK